MPKKQSTNKPSEHSYRVILIGGLVVIVVLTSGVLALNYKQQPKDSNLPATPTSAVEAAPRRGRPQAKGPQADRERAGLVATISQSSQKSLTAADEAGIIKMREEEKLARDVYLTLADQYNLSVFSNIAKAEQTHMDSVKVLLDKYKINDPVVNDMIGEFSDPEIKQLYDELVAKGKTSTKDALLVGATIEDLDIYDLDKLTQETDNPDIKLVYERLTLGSENHLRAFTRNLKELGVNYEPEYISQERYEAIVAVVTGGYQRGLKRR